MPLPTPEGRAGRLTMPDGQPVAHATVVVETLSIMQPPGSAWPGTPIHRFETETDGQGRWRVPGEIALGFGIPVPHLMPLQLDEYTFTAADGRTLRRRPGLASWRPQGEAEAEPTLRSNWDAPPPTSVVILPVFGVMGGEGQTISGHMGALLLIFRNRFGVGLRVAAEAGKAGAGASAAVVVPFRGGDPVVGLELGARYVRPWSNDEGRDWVAPEIAFDLMNLRFGLTLLDLGTGAAKGESPALGVGWGFF